MTQSSYVIGSVPCSSAMLEHGDPGLSDTCAQSDLAWMTKFMFVIWFRRCLEDRILQHQVGTQKTALYLSPL